MLGLGLLWTLEQVSVGGVCWPCASSSNGTEPGHGPKVTEDSKRAMAVIQAMEIRAWLSRDTSFPLLWCPKEGLWGLQHPPSLIAEIPPHQVQVLVVVSMALQLCPARGWAHKGSSVPGVPKFSH